MSVSASEIQRLLYEDEDGRIVGLDEVQLLDPPPLSRIPAVKSLLKETDLYVVFQAALVLAAWGDSEGLAKIEELINKRVHTIQEFAPHRIYDYDNVYDELAYAVYLYGLSSKHETDRKRIFEKLLRLYGPSQFESKLKYALLKSDFHELSPAVKEAIERAVALNRPYLASQLLPVLARWEPGKAWDLIPQFLSYPRQTPDPVLNVAEALGYINRSESKNLLRDLENSSDTLIAQKARESLRKLGEER